jgi:phenylalanyl-tRNA synthetase alpha chain
LSVDEKKSRGAAINLAKQAIEAALTPAARRWPMPNCRRSCKAEALDVTLPGRQRGRAVCTRCPDAGAHRGDLRLHGL